MKLTPKQLVTMVLAVSVAAVLTPVGVMAATGTLVNVTDPLNSARKARVTHGGALQVEQRAGLPVGAASRHFVANNLTFHKLAEATYPERIGVTEVTLGSHGPVGSTYGHNYVDLVAYVQTSGSSPCGPVSAFVSPPPGYERKVLRRFVVRNLQQSIQATWNGPALVVPAPAAAGRKVCVQLEVQLISTETTLWLGGTAYKYTP
ncbi:MAG TPA: hypothetical protein VNA20_11170 [Frankiaceae bacterium]|nr:hypothetical protein [Frankiaceae bacterium]